MAREISISAYGNTGWAPLSMAWPCMAEETREAIRSRAEDGRDYVRERARQAREQAGEWVDRGKDVLTQQKEQFRSAYEAVRQAYQEATTTEGVAKNL